MFETAAYHRASLQWPPSAAAAPAGYPMSTFDTAAAAPTSRLVPQGPVPQSTTGYSGLVDHRGRYGVAAGGGPLYDGRTAAVRDVLLGCGRFSEPAGGSTGVTDVGRQSSSSSVAAFSPLSLGQDGPATSTGAVADCPPPVPRLPAAAYGYSAPALTPTDDRVYYGTSNGRGPTSATFPTRDPQAVPGCVEQPTSAGFRAPAALSLGGFNPRTFMNDVIGE